MRRPFAWMIRHWALSASLMLVACAALGYSFAAPAPPREIRIAVSTAPGSTYGQAAEAYATRLAATGFHVIRRPTGGSLENLALLRAREVDVALVQGGIADPQRDAGLESLGAAFPEPAWVFLRTDRGHARLADLRGRRVAIGPPGSGTRAVALAMFAANDIAPVDIQPLPLAGQEAADALLSGAVDGAIMVSAGVTGWIDRLMRAGPEVALMDFTGSAQAYGARLPFLAPVKLPEGGLSIGADLPPQAVTLLAPVASVVMRADAHPKVVSLLVGIMREVQRPRTLFVAEGEFPNTRMQDLPMNADAERTYAHGRSTLQTWLPFWAAVWLEQALFILVPVLGMALPLTRFGPALYARQMRRRVWRHYDTLRAIELEAARTGDAAAWAALRDRLEILEERVARLAMPFTFRRYVYALRHDIAYVRAKLARGPAGAPAHTDRTQPMDRIP